MIPNLACRLSKSFYFVCASQGSSDNVGNLRGSINRNNRSSSVSNVSGYWLNNEGSIPGSGISGVLFPSSPKSKGPWSPPRETLNMLFSGTLSPGVQHSESDDSSPPSRPTQVRNTSVKFRAAPTERISVKFGIRKLKK
jgi:hypothetical protein